MILAVEVWNLESHQHTRVTFGKGLNLLCGQSDSGKSSLIRAICIPAYNHWSEEMLRIGCKSARVLVETERGSVEVERGPGVHRWVVKWTEDGVQKKEEYTKIGRGNIPERATFIMGMPRSTLAGLESLPNTMMQLERPFLLSDFGGKECSAGTVSQVIDEIGGLVGLDGLLRDINLDLVRCKRRGGELQTQLDALTVRRNSLEDASPLKTTLEASRSIHNDVSGLVERLALAEGLDLSWSSLRKQLQETALVDDKPLDACDSLLATLVSSIDRQQEACAIENELTNNMIQEESLVVQKVDFSAMDVALQCLLSNVERRTKAIGLQQEFDRQRILVEEEANCTDGVEVGNVESILKEAEQLRSRLSVAIDLSDLLLAQEAGKVTADNLLATLEASAKGLGESIIGETGGLCPLCGGKFNP